ncbi:MAG: hypothetical protein MUF06_07585, partial [Pirellulaceae bacterium]|nr:hypothetical protein [Pirellulaceae bacterium]
MAGKPIWCEACARELSPPTTTMCPRCAAPCPEHVAKFGPCPSCRGVRYAFDGALALGMYDGPLRRAVLKTKHARHERLAVDLGRQLGIALGQRWANAEECRVCLDATIPSSQLLVVSVPMFWLQRAYRGANGAERMAAGVAEILGLRSSPETLVCRRFLKKQSELKPAERRRNVREAFRTSRWQSIKGRRILLIDDVLTTGATPAPRYSREMTVPSDPHSAHSRAPVQGKLRLGTRASPLARWQANWVAEQLAARGTAVELVPITTQGDVKTQP